MKLWLKLAGCRLLEVEGEGFVNEERDIRG